MLNEIDNVMTPRVPDVPLPQPTLPDVPLPQPTLPARLPSTLVAAVIPIQRTSSAQTSAQRDRQSRPAILGILGQSLVSHYEDSIVIF